MRKMVSAPFTQNADLKIKNRYIMEVTDLYEDTYLSLWDATKTWLIQRLCWDYWHPKDMR